MNIKHRGHAQVYLLVIIPHSLQRLFMFGRLVEAITVRLRFNARRADDKTLGFIINSEMTQICMPQT